VKDLDVGIDVGHQLTSTCWPVQNKHQNTTDNQQPDNTCIKTTNT